MRVTQAILPVAGKGTRFLPWTKVVPKELLPLGNRPIIAHLVDEVITAGIRDICFVISRGKEAIPEYFAHDPEFESDLRAKGKADILEHFAPYKDVRFHTVYQDEQLGDGHALLAAADWVRSPGVAVLFGDDLFVGASSGLAQLLNLQEHIADPEHAAIALENIPRERTRKYGIVGFTEEHPKNSRIKRVKHLVEKPHPEDAPSTLGIVGRYVIPRSLFEILPKVSAGHGGEIRLIDALISALPTLPVYGYECEGTRIDTGTPEGYAEAVRVWNEEKS